MTGKEALGSLLFVGGIAGLVVLVAVAVTWWIALAALFAIASFVGYTLVVDA